MEIKYILTNTDNPIEQVRDTIEFCRQIDLSLKDNSDLILDLSDINWILPCALLILSNKIIKAISVKGRLTIKPPSKKSVKNYLLDMGFPLGGKKSGNIYTPITHFTNKKNVNDEAIKIFEYIKNSLPDYLEDGVCHILSELSDNIDTHSKFKIASIMTQYYPKKKYLDIGLFDDGKTIPKKFEENKIKFVDDSDAVLKALSGVSTKKEEPGRGFGLSTTKDLTIRGFKGEMHIISRKGAILLNSTTNEKRYILQKNPLNGTLIYLRIYAPKKPLNIREFIE